MLRFCTFFILTFTLGIATAYAEPYRRLVNFEWEAIEGAKGYEVELKQDKPDGKTFNFKVKEAAWNGRLTPGKYLMRLRSKDYRGVPGDWSPPSDFNVGLDTPVMKSPAPQAQVKTNEAEKVEMEFKWAPVGGADKYNFVLTSEDGKTQINEILNKNEFKVSLPVASKYTWKVSATNEEGIASDATSVGDFAVLGKTIESPKIEKPESEFVREIKWTKPDYASAYDVTIYKQNDTNKKWEKFQTFENTQSESLPFDESWPGGKYQVTVKAKSTMRENSSVVKQGFTVRNGDRSPAAEYTALVRKSIDRVTGWYGIASYLITEMQFSSLNPEKNSTVSYSALGGTGRLGLGWFDPKNPWGFLGIIDLSGFTFKGETHTFASAEMNAVVRTSFDDRGELRLQIGPYYKEFPETIGDPYSSVSESLKVSAMGAHVGAEYWYSLTPKLGIQVNGHLYLPLAKVETPNGQDLSPTLSSQIGFLGSYRFSPKFTGLVGYTRREDRVSYNAVANSTNYVVSGDVNQSTIVGNYLNFFAEWAF